MKCFYYSRYRFYHEKAKHPLSFFLISDIHFSNKVSAAKLQAITKQAKQKAPNYILIAGDLIDSLGTISNASDFRRLTSWLEQLGKIAPVLIELGNHDFYQKNPDHKNIFSKKRHWYSERSEHYIDTINSLDNVQILDDQIYEDNNVYIFGFTMSPEYYQFDRDEARSTSLLHPGTEDLDILLSDLNALDQSLISNLPKNKVKIALIHSPIYLRDSQVAAKLYEFDFIISGHMHNGVVPPVIHDFWRTDRGIVAPGKKLFPHDARAKIRTPDDRIITLGPVSTIQASSKPLTFLDVFYPTHIATLELSKNELLIRKPDVKHQYLGY